MPNKTSKTVMITFRMDKKDYIEIQRLIRSSPKQPAMSVGAYCKNTVHQFLWRKH